jgi:ATP-binding cassette, subfamily C, bacterial LapB
MSLPALAKLLARAAAIQGRAIPVSRFEFQGTVGSGIETSSLTIGQAARELWLAVFPQGSAEAHAALGHDNFPAIWIPASGQDSITAADLLLVRGRTTQKVLVENANGDQSEIRPTDLAQGELLSLLTEKNPFDLSGIFNPNKTTGRAKTLFFETILRRRRIFIEAALATILIGLCGLAASLYTMQVYDRVIPLKGFSTLTVLTIGVLIAIGLELLIKQVRAAMTERACRVIDYELSDVFFGKALSIRLDARPKSVGTFASQIRHFEFIRNFMTGTTLLVIADIPLAILFIVVIALIAGPVALLPLLAIPIALFAGFAFRGKLRAINQVHIEESNRKNGLLIEAIDGIESLKAAGAEWKMQSRWNGLTKMLASKELDQRLTTNLSTDLTQVVQQLTYVGIVAAGAYAVAQGNLTMGGLIACSIISSRALQPIARLPSVVAQWQTASISLDTLDSIMAMPDDRPAGMRLILPETCQGGLRLEGLSFQYDENQVVLDIPRLSIRPGERIAIVGAVGSGKSTLLKLLAGLYQPNAGKTFLDDLDMFQIAPEFVRENIGYLPQEIRLFNGTLRDNLTLGLPTPSDDIILKAAQACGLSSAIARHPQGLNLMLHEGGRGLSGGQRQLVGLTRMLIARPRILILDEPTASMDNNIESFVLNHLFEGLPKETTVIMATHKPGVLRHVDRVIVISGGKVSLDGPRDDVIKKLQAVQNSQQPGVSDDTTAKIKKA